MIVTLIVLCEVGFWVLLAAGLALRYPARKPRLGAAVLLCEPLLEVVLLVVTAIDLKNGAEPDWKHGLAAVYIGFTVGLGHSMPYLGGFTGGGPPAKRWTVAAVTALALLQAAIWYVGGDGDVTSLQSWQQKMLFVIGINVVIAGGYTVFPKRERAGR